MKYFGLCVVVAVFLQAATSPLAQDPSSAVDLPSSSVVPPVTPSFGDAFLGAIIAQLPQVGVALAGLVIVAVLALFAVTKVHLERLKSRFSDPFIPQVPSKVQQYAVNALVVGIGGCGKTSIIRSLTACEQANPDVKTDENRTYSIVNEVSVSRGENEAYRRLTRLYLDDHIGQQFQTIFDSEWARKKGADKIRRCLIIVVDLFKPLPYGTKLSGRKAFDQSRIDENIETYSEAMLQMLSDSMNEGDHYILFINKIDGMDQVSDAIKKSAMAAYKPVIDRLHKIPGKKLDVIVGSAMRGLGLVGSDSELAPKNVLSILVNSATQVK